MNESLKEVDINIGVKKASHRFAGLGNLAWRMPENERFFSPKGDVQASFSKRSSLRESLWVTWKVHAKHCTFVQVDSFRWKRPRWRTMAKFVVVFLWKMRPPSDSLQAETDTSCTLKFTLLCSTLVTGSHTQRSKTSHESGNNPT